MAELNKDIDERKQRMIVAQTSLDRAISALGIGKESSSYISLAEEFFTWVFSQADEVVRTKKPTIVKEDKGTVDIPTPTKPQLEWLEKIQKQYGFTKEQVYKAINGYPNNKDGASKVVKILQKGN